MVHIWVDRHTKRPGTSERCREAVAGTGSFGWAHSHQCTRKPAAFRIVDGIEYGFCNQHDPEAVKKRDEERRDRWRKESYQRTQQYERDYQIRNAQAACKTALEQISAGHNDPRSLAAETLKLFPSSPLPSKHEAP